MMPWLLFACAEWPRYANLPEDSGTGVDPGDSGVPSAPFDWQPAADRLEQTDDAPDPARAEDLADGIGLLSRANLDGTGWAQVVPEREACAEDGTVSSFPPYETGMYAADVDWWVVRIPAAGRLCGVFSAVSESVRVDVVPYPLVGACSLPGAPLRDDDGNIAGYATESADNAWMVAVEPGLYAIAAAGYAPNGAEKQLYSWGLAFFTQTPDLCPELER